MQWRVKEGGVMQRCLNEPDVSCLQKNNFVNQKARERLSPSSVLPCPQLWRYLWALSQVSLASFTFFFQQKSNKNTTTKNNLFPTQTALLYTTLKKTRSPLPSMS